ncbi:redoxin domain-containing protein [Weeksellaceae bacterium KMM 9713]|uniref:Redoxin domain-containing protein n=1 Tax=Profundicola chukchiensis TaxID=2961959 RepID=A0A9X4MZG9_9FLAO|nr:redoxin domain-containing protein [Profundicola chukchiensis]MDG4945680.1 redoxin domain-containing protein [Profundicola chukchiensis]
MKINNIKLKDLEGNAVDLMQKYANENLLIIIYNNDCMGCTGRGIPLAYDFQQKYPSIKVVGIHSDFPNREGTKENINAIFTSGEAPFPIFIDENHKVYDQLEADGTPHWLLINKNGELYKSIFGSQDGAQNRLFYSLESMLEEQ